MKIPSCFYGTKLETKKECAKIARKVWKGDPLTEAVAKYELIDTKEAREGCLVVAYPYGINGSDRHFYLTWIAKAVEDKYEPFVTDKKDMDTIFNQFIEHDWSILGLSENTGSWFGISVARRLDSRYQWQPYLRNLCRFWDVFCGEGKRYIGLGGESTTLWKANSALRYILGNMGVPYEEVSLLEDPADLKGLCEKYNLLTMDVLNNPEILKRHPFTR
jgi:hypothetical protein